ncbi:hypothetical protein Pelo_13165 [Pelomyxa schiedti]|nr:hypothetical protein Pelo_13165 [Pelomyxa schiedti]
MVGAMGHGHATSFVRMLWSDWVRPTILFFVVDVKGCPSWAATSCAGQAESTTTVSFALSPLLLSVALAPAPPPACIEPTAFNTRRVDSGRVADVRFHGDQYLPVVWVRDVHSSRLPGGAGGVAVARGRYGRPYAYDVNSKWAAMVSFPTCKRGADAGKAELTVASLSRARSVDDHTGMEFLSHSVVVEMPFVESTGHNLCHMYLDKSVDSEVIVVQCIHGEYSGNIAVIFVVDMEQTYNTKRLTVLSTTTFKFPAHYFRSLVVLRNWLPRSPGYGSRTFFVTTFHRDSLSSSHLKPSHNEVFRVEELTGNFTHVISNVIDVFRVCDSLLGVSYRLDEEQELIKFYHRDDPTRPLHLPGSMSYESHKGKTISAGSGFVFSAFINLIDVFDPTSGFLILTITLSSRDNIMDQVAAVAAVTTRSQLGALAAGATISRCGANSAMVGVMGHGHATSFVRMLWFDWLRPTIRFFVVEVSDDTSISFALSPLLLSVARAPSPPPARAFPTPGDLWVDISRVADVRFGVLRLRHVQSGRGGGVAVAQSPPRCTFAYGVNSKWAAMLAESGFGHSCCGATLTVASLAGLECQPSVNDTGSDFFAYRGGAGWPLVNSFAVEIPSLQSPGPRQVRMHLDKSVDREVIVVQQAQKNHYQNIAVILVVDMEQTYNTKSLAILSTTTCTFPVSYSFESLVVLRNSLPRSPGYGSRSFFVTIVHTESVYSSHSQPSNNEVFRVEESTTNFTNMLSNVAHVFRVCDSLLGVSYNINKKQECIQFYHRDDPTRPLNLPGSMIYESHKGKKVRTFSADSGFVFSVFGNMIDVIEPTSGFLVLTITFSSLDNIACVTHFSFFLN